MTNEVRDRGEPERAGFRDLLVPPLAMAVSPGGGRALPVVVGTPHGVVRRVPVSTSHVVAPVNGASRCIGLPARHLPPTAAQYAPTGPRPDGAVEAWGEGLKRTMREGTP